MQFTIREVTQGVQRLVLAPLALGLFLAFLGPFRTQNLEIGPRIAFWLSLVGTGFLLAHAAARLTRGWRAGASLQWVSVAILSSLPQTFIVSWALVQLNPGRIVNFADLPMLFLSVLSIQALIAAVQYWLSAVWVEAPHAAASDPSGTGPDYGRIAPSLRIGLLAIQAEDHYVRLHRPGGSTLVLHRLSDAIAEVGSTNGLRVHRGWWVAGDAITGTFIRDGKRWLMLRNGLEVPVSRTYLRAVSERNWPRLADGRSRPR